INQALDQITAINEPEKTPLQEIFKHIADKTGVRVEMAPEAWDLLPYGEQTTMSVKIENKTLRGGLQAIGRKLGRVPEVKEEVVQLEPLPALNRLGRRATVEELEVLDLLGRTPLELSGDRSPVKQVLSAVDDPLVKANSPFNVENRAPDTVGNTPIPIARNETLLDALEMIPQSTDATWYPWG